jgi:hypothetical protein
MSRTGSNSFSSTVPGDYTNRNYPLQYYFEVRDKGEVWFFPGLWSKLQPEPYFVVPGRIADK